MDWRSPKEFAHQRKHETTSRHATRLCQPSRHEGSAWCRLLSLKRQSPVNLFDRSCPCHVKLILQVYRERGWFYINASPRAKWRTRNVNSYMLWCKSGLGTTILCTLGCVKKFKLLPLKSLLVFLKQDFHNTVSKSAHSCGEQGRELVRSLLSRNRYPSEHTSCSTKGVACHNRSALIKTAPLRSATWNHGLADTPAALLTSSLLMHTISQQKCGLIFHLIRQLTCKNTVWLNLEIPHTFIAR